MSKRILHLPVMAVYFHDIKSGNKLFEFRQKTEYWAKRLVGQSYDEIQIKLGYPRRDDMSRIVVRPWLGYEEQTIIHPHFGKDPVDVFAIRVN